MRTFIYPHLSIRESNKEYEIRTILRKEKDGVWYNALFIHRVIKNKEFDKGLAMKYLNHKVYSFLIMGEIDPDLKINDSFIYPKSSYQMSESERLKEGKFLMD